MADRRESLRVLYPFVPNAAAQALWRVLAGIKDIRLFAEGTYSAPGTPATADKPFISYLQTLNATTRTLTFHMVTVDKLYVRTFVVPTGTGLARVSSSETSPDSIMLIDLAALYSPGETVVDVGVDVTDLGVVVTDGGGTFVFAAADLEVEPGRCCWGGLDAVSGLYLYNEYRDPDQFAVTGAADSLEISWTATGATAAFEDGYNCHLRYEEDNETLFLEGGAGLGMGLPDLPPWDSPPPPRREFVRLEMHGMDEPAYPATRSAEFSTNAATNLRIFYRVRGASGAAGVDASVTLDGGVPIALPATTSDLWELSTEPIGYPPAEHLLEMEVTGASAGVGWDMLCVAGSVPIKTINGLGGGNVVIEGAKSVTIEPRGSTGPTGPRGLAIALKEDTDEISNFGSDSGAGGSWPPGPIDAYTKAESDLKLLAKQDHSLTYVAGEAITAYRVVRVLSGSVYHASCDQDTHMQAVTGIATTGAVMVGSSVTVKILGTITYAGWAWTPGYAIYNGINGVLTQTAPGTGNYIREVGVALSATSMLVRVLTPIDRTDE